MEKSYVLIVENDVFYKINLPSTLPIAGRWIAGLGSNPSFVDSTFFPEVCVGAFWHEGSFYLPEDPEKLSPLTPLESGISEDGLKIAAITDGDIFGVLTFPTSDSSPIELDMLRMAFSASPTVIECSTDNPVDVGWTWNGVTFTPPTEG